MQSFRKIIILFMLLIVVGTLYKRFEDKRRKDESLENNNAIEQFLLERTKLSKSNKPILWIHVPFEYNSRKWSSFGSRSSWDLNQPYLYLTVKSIINKCSSDFTISIIDDSTFKRLIPSWNIDMSLISKPIVENIRQLGMMRLLYIYGGLICPLSFLCMKNLNDLYINGTSNDHMFICETVDRNITSTTQQFYPSLTFCGANKENKTVSNLIDFMQRVTSTDYTAEVNFLGQFDKWCKQRISEGTIHLIDGKNVGVKNVDNRPILIEDLMSTQYLNLYPKTYGILIPRDSLLNRLKYEWFTRMSSKQVMESDVIIGKYLLLYNSPDKDEGIIEPVELVPNWISFWKTPLYNGLYGLKPKGLGDNLLRLTS